MNRGHIFYSKSIVHKIIKIAIILRLLMHIIIDKTKGSPINIFHSNFPVSTFGNDNSTFITLSIKRLTTLSLFYS